MVNFIFHIGMGKTGTSSIQSAMQQNAELLARHDMHYIGLTFDAVDPSYGTVLGTRKFLTNDCAEDPEAYADRFASHYEAMAKETGVKTVVMSNETIMGSARTSTVFFKALSERAENVRFIAYIRDPYKWLPSAYAQWGLTHKVSAGPIRSFEEMGRNLIGQFDMLKPWCDMFGKAVDVRLFVPGGMVGDFLSAIGIEGEEVEEAFRLTRKPKAELYLRGVYNDRFPGEVLPGHFDQNLMRGRQRSVRSLEDMYQTLFGQGALDDIIAEKSETFDYLTKEFGLKLSGATVDETDIAADQDFIRDGLIDYLVDIVITQSYRLRRMDLKLEELEAKLGGDEDSKD